jgi:hypothetical protein
MTEIPDNSKLEGSPYIMPISDEEIMAYADGALPPERRAAVREALAKDPALMEKLESFLFTRGPFARAYDEVLAAPVPDRLLRILQSPAALKPPPRRLRDLFNPRKHKRALAGVRAASFAVATVCAMLVGAWLAGHAARYGVVSFDPYEFVLLDEQGLMAMPGLQQALDRAAGGETAYISRRLSVKLRSTSRNKHGEWCREFELVYASGTKGRGLACRGTGGAWRVEAANVPRVKPYDTAGKGPEKGPHESANPRPGDEVVANEVVEAVKQRLGLEKALAASEEEGLRGRGWLTKP